VCGLLVSLHEQAADGAFEFASAAGLKL